MSIDNCLHSIFGASKVAADVMCQEFGRYFHMPVGVFRGGCLTGPQHAAVELHGYLVLHRALRHDRQGISGIRLQGQAGARPDSLATTWHDFSWSSSTAPRCGEVYNMGGGRRNSLSILETIDALAGMGYQLKHSTRATSHRRSHLLHLRPDESAGAFPALDRHLRSLANFGRIGSSARQRVQRCGSRVIP